jgi:hypothetical protein
MNEATSPSPTVEAVFHVEPHPDPVVRALIEEIERLRAENETLKAQLYELGKGP